VDEIVLADDPATIAQQINEKVEYLRLERNRNSRRSISST
jgi:hypothetical protein